MTTELSTPRLRELEVEVLRRHKDRKLRLPDANPSFTAVSEGRVEGYKLALADVALVLAAAEKVLERTNHGNISSMEGCLERFALRDALAQFKGE